MLLLVVWVEVVVVVVEGVVVVVLIGIEGGGGPTHTASKPVPIHRPCLCVSGTLLLMGGV